MPNDLVTIGGTMAPFLVEKKTKAVESSSHDTLIS